MESAPMLPPVYNAFRNKRHVVISATNPHIQEEEIANFLKNRCMMVGKLNQILDENMFWSATWSVNVRLFEDLKSADGLMHLPLKCTLGNSVAYITYAEKHHICKESSLGIFQTGQKTKDCPKKTTCNPKGQGKYVIKDYPMRTKEQFRKKEELKAGFYPIPLEMRDEVMSGVRYIKTLTNRNHKLDPDKIDLFGDILTVILCHKFIKHWYPENPKKGREYRRIKNNKWKRDESILKACAYSGLKYYKLDLPKVLTLWINPYRVTCRLGYNSCPFTVARFDPRIKRVRDVPLSEASTPLYVNCSISPQVDYPICGSSQLPSPSFSSEDSDSGLCGRSEGNTTPLNSHSSTEELNSENPVANQASFRTSSPLWIGPCKVQQFYSNFSENPQHIYWL